MRYLLAVLLLAGCSHASINATSSTGVSTVPPPPGSTVSTGQVGMHVHISSSALAAVVIAGMFLAAAVEDARDERPFPSFSAFSDWFRGTPRPALAEDRKVSEQDCSKPIDWSAGNLRCK